MENNQEKESDETYKKVIALLDSNKIKYTHKVHEAVLTSEASANLLEKNLKGGAKALFLADKFTLSKLNSEKYEKVRTPQSPPYDPEGEDKKVPVYILAVMSAEKQIDWKALKKLSGLKRMSFADLGKVKELTGCLPGAVPPYGSLFGVKTFMDQSLVDQGDTIFYNAGLRTRTVEMATADYLEVEKPFVCNFVK